ncbi:MAG: hypothetical protein WBN10_19495 [Polyangiales bacterium]
MAMLDETDSSYAEGRPGGSGMGRPGAPVDPYRLRRALWAGRRLLIGAAVGGLLFGFLWAKLGMTSDYETTVVLKYEGDLNLGALGETSDALGPASDALMHQSVLGKIREETGFDGDLTDLAESIAYNANQRWGTLEFSVLGDSGEDASAFARVVTDVFLSYHKERQSRRIDAEIARTLKRIDAAEHQAEAARRRYNAFREQHGISNLPTEQQSMVESAAQLRADSELAVSEIRALEGRVMSLETQLANTSKTNFVSGGDSPERATYNQLRIQLARAKSSLSDDHPEVQSLQQQVDQLRAQLRSGGGSGSRSDGLVSVNATYQGVEGQLGEAKSNLAAARERQRGLAEMADRAQHRIEAFSGIEGEVSALLASVKVSENLLDDLRRTNARLADALRDPPSGFVVLDPGAIPERPIRSPMKIVVFATIPILGLAVVLLLLLRREFRGLTVQTPAEVGYWGNGPVLAATAWPNDAQGPDELVAGLDDVVPWAEGELLVIGASPAESRLARELAERVNGDWLLDEGGRGTQSPQDIGPYERAPLQTPPPSGPYPVGGSASAGTSSVALVRRPSVAAEPMGLARRSDRLRLEAWEGPHEGQSLRRAARLADRVVILVRSGAVSALSLNGIQRRLGRQQGVGYIVVGVPEELLTLPDRVGDVAAFWRG